MRSLVLAGLLALVPAGAAAAEDPPAYVGSQACAACHTGEAQRWSRSHHALAWTEATAKNILADFDGTVFTHGAMTARFRIEADGSHHVTVTETDGTVTDYRVHSVAGVEPLQQYLIETEPGRLQGFDVVWDTRKGRWFHLYPDADLPPSDAMHWTGPYKTWNARCAQCHATGYEKNYDAARRRYASTAAEIGVGCEACHGPGGAHVARAKARGSPGILPKPRNGGFSARLDDTRSSVEQCATCHARRAPYGDASPLPGTPFHDAYRLALLRPGLYEADGQIRDEVYVYGSFLQSRMYEAGVGCLDCHDAHTAELVAEGNAVCTECHSPAGNERFATLRRAQYDSPAHHFHPPGSEAAECTSCHMPERVYMGNDWRADHSLRVPRPDLVPQTGAPDACTGCHEDRSAEWAAAEIAARFPAGASRRAHFGVVLARGRRDAAAAAGALVDLAADRAQPGIARASALWLLGTAATPEAVARLAPLLRDADPLVRAAAARLDVRAAQREWVVRLLEVLDDPSRSVRMDAAVSLLDAPIARLPRARRESLDRALGEWRASLAAHRDFPETHLRLGGVALTMRNLPAARAAFREAVRLDPQLTDAWVMLVRIAAASQGAEAARRAVAEALAAVPEDPTLLRLQRELSR